MHQLTRAALLVAVLCSFAGTAASAAKDVALPARFQTWLDEVALLITPAERKAFLALAEDHRRDAFIVAFWKAREPGLRETYYARREEARERFGGIADDAAKIWTLHGEPADIWKTDCAMSLWPIEVWTYGAVSSRVGRGTTVLLYRPAAGRTYRRWQREDGYAVLMALRPTEPFPHTEVEGVGPRGKLPPDPTLEGLGDETAGSDFSAFAHYVKHYCGNHGNIYARLLDVMRRVTGVDRTAAARLEAPPEPDPEWLASFAAGSTDAPAAEARDALSPDELRWLDEVAVLIGGEERRAFLTLPRTHQRAGFVEAFWKARDPNPRTPQNEARTVFEARLETVRERWQSPTLDQARVYLLNGEPIEVTKTDCNDNLWPLEIWRYAYSDRSRRPFQLLFYQPPPGVGPFVLWHANTGYAVLVRRPLPGRYQTAPRPGTGEFNPFYRLLRDGDEIEPAWCRFDAAAIIDAMRRLESGDLILAEVVLQAPTVDAEWFATYRAYSTEVPDAAEPLAAELQVDYPGRHQSRTLVRGSLLVPPVGADTPPARAFSLTGEVLRGDVLHESFRYFFQLAAPGDDGSYPLVFERFLRPGDFRLVLKLEDAGSGRAVRIVRELTVPAAPAEAPAAPAGAAPPAPQPGAEGFRLLAPATDLVSGVVRIDAEVGDPRVHEVAFAVDGKPVLTKRRPPWSVELRLGELPRSMRVRAVARDAAGEVVGEDEVQLNPAPHRFAVRLVEPREGVLGGAASRAPLRVRVEVQVPPDRSLDRLELFLDESPVATLFQEPWEAVLPPLPSPPPTFLRALGHLAGGGTAEDVVLLAGGNTQRGTLDVDLVEVYTAALDGQGRPVQDLGEGDFTVREDGRPQSLRRFQRVTDLPLQVGMLVDTSASMAEMLPKVQEAALAFFRDALAPADRAAVVTFSEEPRLAAPFTRDLSRLGAALVGLQAARGTALWDSVVYTLHYFQGTPGRRALLVFSDGADHGSRFTYDQALAYAQHSGVSVYALSFGSAASSVLESGRRRLANLAEATGGRSFVLGSADELPATYDAIGEDLRSQYLLVYQSDGQGERFRAVDVQIKRPGVTARTMRGYIP